jgi:osmotically-inducible protein OsmY
MRPAVWLLAALALVQAGCTTAIIVAYQTMTEIRTVQEQHEDIRMLGTIKDELATKAGVASALQIHVFSYLGRVVLAGIVEPGSTMGQEAVAIARRVEGVRKVDTYFLPRRPSYTRDLTISLKLETRIVTDLELKVSQLDWTVLGGHVVLVGLVDSDDKVKRLVEHARSIDNVIAVRSWLQVRAPVKKREPR